MVRWIMVSTHSSQLPHNPLFYDRLCASSISSWMRSRHRLNPTEYFACLSGCTELHVSLLIGGPIVISRQLLLRLDIPPNSLKRSTTSSLNSSMYLSVFGSKFHRSNRRSGRRAFSNPRGHDDNGLVCGQSEEGVRLDIPHQLFKMFYYQLSELVNVLECIRIKSPSIGTKGVVGP